MVVKWLRTISTIIIWNIKHIQPVKVEKIAFKTSRLQFRKSPRNDKSGTLVPKKKAKFSNFGSNRFLSRIEPFWVILRKKFFFEKIIEKWLSLEAWWPLWRKWKSKISKIGYFHELDHSEWFGAKKKFSKNFDRSSNMAIFSRYGSTAKIVSFEDIFFGTWNFQGMFLTILSTISESFRKI